MLAVVDIPQPRKIKYPFVECTVSAEYACRNQSDEFYHGNIYA